jgi:uncharacterized protein YndB with AHSA1/START domain
MKQIRAEIEIGAPAHKVWDTITDIENYPRWNTFTPRITLANADLKVGAEFDLDCRMTDRKLLKNEHEVVLALEPEKFCFCMGTSRTRGRPGITSFRWQICEPIEGGRTRFINYEEFHGALAPVVYLLYQRKLRLAFKKYCQTLKNYTEENC